MLIEVDPAVIADFVTRKIAQGEGVMTSLPGMSVVSSGERGSQIILRHEGDICEGVTIGQMEHAAFEMVGSRKNPVRREMPNERKPAERRGIDLTDEQIAAVIAQWRAGKSALDLPFITHVYDEKGRLRI